MSIRLLITGSRSWDNIDYVRLAFLSLAEEYGNDITLVSGACPTGADRLGEIVAAELGWQIERYPADWNTYGKRAGFVRNSEMVATNPDLVIGFVRKASKGATMTVNLSKNKGLFTIVHTWTDYPYTCYNLKEYNTPSSNDSADDPYEETLF